MLTKVPGCRAVCRDVQGDLMSQLIAAFKNLRTQGASEEQSLNIALDSIQLAHLFSENSLGRLHSVAKAMVTSGCAECAVNFAYTD